MKTVTGDILQADTTYIVHSVNCKGVTGGLAVVLFNKYPEAYDEYTEYIDKMRLLRVIPLGYVYFHKETEPILVSAFTQDNPGPYTDYDAFKRALEGIAFWLNPEDTVGIPYKIGCGIGGGDWDVISGIIEKALGNQAVIYQREQDKED